MKSKYDIFLEEFTRKFTLMNLRHQKENSEINKRVQQIIKMHIRSGWLSKQDVNRQHSLLSRSIEKSLNEKHLKDQYNLKAWESNRLQQLFPELNNV